MIHVMYFSSSFGAHGAYCSCKSMCRQLRRRSNALTTACILLTAPVSPQSLRRNTSVHAPPRHSKMEADRVCGLVIVWVYHQVAQPVAKIKSQGQPGSQYHPEHESASSQATRHAHATETRILRYALEQRDGACTLTSQPAPCTTLQDRFVRDSSAEASKQT